MMKLNKGTLKLEKSIFQLPCEIHTILIRTAQPTFQTDTNMFYVSSFLQYIRILHLYGNYTKQ